MNEIDRDVRAEIYRLLVAGGPGPSAHEIAPGVGLDVPEVERALARLAEERRIALVPGQWQVAMAHPFSGVPSDHLVRIGDRTWWANCGWDGFAVLALLGDGDVEARSPLGSGVDTWRVRDGVVAPGGLVHFVVPVREFWDDIGFT